MSKESYNELAEKAHKTEYTNEKVANEMLDHLVSLMILSFCPVIKDKCKGKNCLAFSAGLVNKIGNDIFLYPPHCNNPQVSGVAEVNGDIDVR